MAETTNLTSEAARELSQLGASKGGEARAAKLSPERRREIGRAAVQARWAKQGKQPMPQSMYAGTLKIADIDFDCAVLDDGSRVVSEQKFMAAMGMYRSGALSVRRETDEGGARTPLFLAHKNLKPFVAKHLGGVHFEPLRYRTPEGSIAHGIKSEIISKVCEVWIDAEKANVLGVRQRVVAQKADILLRALANVGMAALIDEATGYQDVRAKDALAKILEAFIAKEIRGWVSTFPVDYYKELFRLRQWTFPQIPADQQKRPLLVGKITNDVIYDRLAPGVRAELNNLTLRNEKGQLKRKLFQRLTKDYGHPKLKEHLASVVALMRAADDWDQFKRMLNRSLPRYTDTPYLPFEG